MRINRSIHYGGAYLWAEFLEIFKLNRHSQINTNHLRTKGTKHVSRVVQSDLPCFFNWIYSSFTRSRFGMLPSQPHACGSSHSTVSWHSHEQPIHNTFTSHFGTSFLEWTHMFQNISKVQLQPTSVIFNDSEWHFPSLHPLFVPQPQSHQLPWHQHGLVVMPKLGNVGNVTKLTFDAWHDDAFQHFGISGFHKFGAGLQLFVGVKGWQMGCWDGLQLLSTQFEPKRYTLIWWFLWNIVDFTMQNSFCSGKHLSAQATELEETRSSSS